MLLKKIYLVEVEQDKADEREEQEILNAIHTVFGIHSYHIAYTCESNLEEIKKTLQETIQKEVFHTFKVEVKRSDKSFPQNSVELAPIFGSVVLKNKEGVKVDVHHPDVVVHVEIRMETIMKAVCADMSVQALLTLKTFAKKHQ